jgi:hypothetical protein
MAEERKKPLIFRAEDATTGERQAVRADDLHKPPRQRDKLPPELETKANELYDRIGKMIGLSKAEWYDGFLYDQHPENELKIWWTIAEISDFLWKQQPKALANLKRDRLTRLVIAVSSGVVDIPSQMGDVTDEQVQVVRDFYNQIFS